MRFSSATVVIALGWSVLCLNGIVCGQVVEEINGESLRTAARRQAEQNPADLQQAAQLIVRQTNAFRREEDRRSVETNRELTETARYFARYLADRDVLSHTADGNRPAQRARERGYEFCIVTENIGYQFRTGGLQTEELARRFMQGWQDSPDHRRNLLDADVTEIGVAVARSDQTGAYYGVQMFGRPEADRIEFDIRNESNATVEYEIDGRTWSLPPRFSRTHQRCRPADVAFQLPVDDEQVRTQTVTPRSGERYVVVRDQGRLQVRERR